MSLIPSIRYGNMRSKFRKTTLCILLPICLFILHVLFVLRREVNMSDSTVHVNKQKGNSDFRLTNQFQMVHHRVRRNPSSVRFIYNRVPKCGSTTVYKILSHFSKLGRYNTHYSLIFQEYHVNESEQDDICDTIKRYATPMLYNRHVFYFNMTSRCNFTSQPVWINVLRDPVDRYISFFNFLRFHANTFVAQHAAEHQFNLTLDECIGKDTCKLSCFDQVSFFCGNEDVCRKPETALPVAKRRLEEDYSIVGLNEDLLGFFQILEVMFPSFFRGAPKIYKENEMKWWNATSTKKKILPGISTLETMKKKMKTDIEFFYFARHHYYKVKHIVVYQTRL